jgi:nucleotide-binding universal stress UspA family protein
MTTTETQVTAQTGLVLFSYDGSELAEYAIGYAGTQLATPRDAVVVCVWQPAEVGFQPIGGQHFDAGQAGAVREAAEQTAAHGAKLAQQAGFNARSLAIEASPTWKGIAAAAEHEGASLIVVGAHRHSGIVERLLGHVTSDLVAHALPSVLVAHQPG